MKALKTYLIIIISLFLINESFAGDELIGKTAPDFQLQKLGSNDSISLSSMRGKVILVDFWATWCAPCKKSLPYLAQLDRKYRNFKVVAVNIDDDKENAIQFLKQFKLKFNAVYDEDKKAVALYDVPVMPTAYLIDQYGKVQYIHSGYNEESMTKLEFAIKGLIDRP